LFAEYRPTRGSGISPGGGCAGIRPDADKCCDREICAVRTQMYNASTSKAPSRNTRTILGVALAAHFTRSRSIGRSNHEDESVD